MPWKLDWSGKPDFHAHDPEKIQEIDCPTIRAFGVELHSRYGQASEMACMLQAVTALHRRDRDALALVRSVFWDSKGCCMTITLGPTPPFWNRREAEALGRVFQEFGCPLLSVEREGRDSVEVEPEWDADWDDEEADAPQEVDG